VVPQERYLPPWRGDLEPSGGQSAWVDPSEPIYTDPSLFEITKYLQGINRNSTRVVFHFLIFFAEDATTRRRSKAKRARAGKQRDPDYETNKNKADIL